MFPKRQELCRNRKAIRNGRVALLALAAVSFITALEHRARAVSRRLQPGTSVALLGWQSPEHTWKPVRK